MRVGLLSSTAFGRRCLAEGILPVPEVSLAGVLTTPPQIEISYSDRPVPISAHAAFDDLADRAGAEVMTLDGAPTAATYLHVVERWGIELLLALGWYYLVPKSVLAAVPRGALGIHASLLPKYRGGAPIPWAIINGERETGATLFHLDEGVDSGDIVMQHRFPIEAEDTCATVYDKATVASVTMLREALPLLESDAAPRHPQDESAATQYPQRSPADGRIDWDEPAPRIHDFVRAQTRPYPGAFTTHGDGRLTVWRTRALPDRPAATPGTVLGSGRHGEGLEVATGQGTPLLLEVEEDGVPMSGADYLRTHVSGEGTVLG